MLWKRTVTGHRHSSHCASYGPRQRHPRVFTWTALERTTSTPPPSKLLMGAHRTHRDALPEARFARTAIYSMALYTMPPHVVRTVRHACKLLPPWPIKGGTVPSHRGTKTDNAHLHAFLLHTILALALISTSGTWRTSLLSRLACSPPLQAPRCTAI
jgi:hypothetical protein